MRTALGLLGARPDRYHLSGSALQRDGQGLGGFQREQPRGTEDP